MNLYLLTQYVTTGYDTYNAVVVAAENERAARLTHPSSFYSYDHDGRLWFHYVDGTKGRERDDHAWVGENIEAINVRLIGVAAEDVKAGVVCASLRS